jgi:hypothetical protein
MEDWTLPKARLAAPLDHLGAVEDARQPALQEKVERYSDTVPDHELSTAQVLDKDQRQLEIRKYKVSRPSTQGNRFGLTGPLTQQVFEIFGVEAGEFSPGL